MLLHNVLEVKVNHKLAYICHGISCMALQFMLELKIKGFVFSYKIKKLFFNNTVVSLKSYMEIHVYLLNIAKSSMFYQVSLSYAFTCYSSMRYVF